MSERTGTTPRQHAVILHEIAELIRYSGTPETLSKSELIEVVEGLRGWMAQRAIGLLDDSRALSLMRDSIARAEAVVEITDRPIRANAGAATFRDVLALVAALWESRAEVARLREALYERDGSATVCIGCGNGWDTEDGESEHHSAACVLATPETTAGHDHSRFGCKSVFPRAALGHDAAPVVP